jgi:HK97 family phage prohead protease
MNTTSTSEPYSPVASVLGAVEGAASAEFGGELATDFIPELAAVRFERSFEAELAVGDGRTLDLRLAPYNQPATVADPPSFEPYREMFLPGAFERQLAAPDRVKVWLNFEHEQGIRGIIGHGSELHDRADGLDGSFRVLPGSDGDKALELIDEGLLRGVSIEFAALRSRRVDGVVQRLRAHVDKVSLCRFPAYQGAGVLAVRTEPEPELGVGLPAVPPIDAELAGRLEALGVVPLARVATTSKPWDGSPGRYTDEQYLAACLIVRAGDAPAKERGSLPVLEPDGTLNTNALGAAAAALAGARGGLRNVTAGQKAAAARKLVRYYGTAKMQPPASLLALARS